MVNGYGVQEATDIAASAIFGVAAKRGIKVQSMSTIDEIASEILHDAKYKSVSERTVLENWLADDGTLISDRMAARFNRIVKTRIQRGY